MFDAPCDDVREEWLDFKIEIKDSDHSRVFDLNEHEMLISGAEIGKSS